MALDIKRVLKQRGIQAKDLAARMGITPVTLSTHINGNPSVEVLERIAAALDCTVGEFFTDGEDFTALVRDGDRYYRANTLKELAEVVAKIQADRSI